MSFFGSLFGPSTQAVARPKTVLDMVMYAAGLVSNSKDIDILLDRVRLITAKLRPGETPSISENKELVSIYLKIEQYLTAKEAIRVFTQDDLRARLDPNLQKLITAQEAKIK